MWPRRPRISTQEGSQGRNQKLTSEAPRDRHQSRQLRRHSAGRIKWRNMFSSAHSRQQIYWYHSISDHPSMPAPLLLILHYSLSGCCYQDIRQTNVSILHRRMSQLIGGERGKWENIRAISCVTLVIVHVSMTEETEARCPGDGVASDIYWHLVTLGAGVTGV